MDTPVLVALITATAGIVASALAYFFAKQREREAEWRRQKLEHYKALLAGMNGVVGATPSGENKAIFAKAVNNVMLVASPVVLVALRSLLDEIAESNKNRENDNHDALMTELMYAIRDDVGIKPNRAGSEYEFRLWASGRQRE
jgi:hypothetical protein